MFGEEECHCSVLVLLVRGVEEEPRDAGLLTDLLCLAAEAGVGAHTIEVEHAVTIIVSATLRSACFVSVLARTSVVEVAGEGERGVRRIKASALFGARSRVFERFVARSRRAPSRPRPGRR